MEKTIVTKEYRVFLRRLRAVRKAAGITQGQLGERLDESQSLISRCERGERRLDIVEVRAFCQAMGIPFLSFLAEFERALEARLKRKWGRELDPSLASGAMPTAKMVRWRIGRAEIALP